MASGKSKDLAKRTQSEKVLRDKAFKIVSDPKYDGYQRGFVWMVYKIFDKKSSGSGVAASLANKSATEPNYQLANELHRHIIRKSKRGRVYSSSRETIWVVDLADVQPLSKYKRGIKYLLWAINLVSKYGWVVPLKGNRGITIVNAFQKMISKGRKPNKIRVDQGGEFYNLSKKTLKCIQHTTKENPLLLRDLLGR